MTNLAWSGRLDLTIRRGGDVVRRLTVHNQITRVGRNLLRDALRGVVDPSPQISWVALGAGSDAPSDEDLQLQDERFRKQVTAQTPSGIGQMLTTMYVAEGEANDFIVSEAGWYAGDADATADSGVLVARVLIDPFSGGLKSALETLQLDRTDSIVEGA